MRRDSSPFRGAEGWAEVCGVCASAYRDADTYVSLTPVRGGVLDAPRLRDCWATLGAPVRPDQPRPRHPRRTRLRPPPHVSYPAGAARAPFHTGEPMWSFIPGREGVEALPYGALGMCQRANGAVRHPTQGASRTPPPTVVASCRFQRSRKVQFITPVTLYAASPVTLTPVSGGVPDAPCSRDRRAALVASVRPDQPRPRHPRRTRLRPPPHVSYPAGAARAPFHTGEPTLSVHPRRAGVEARPYGILGTFQRAAGVVR